jgi:hypothetical protein
MGSGECQINRVGKILATCAVSWGDNTLTKKERQKIFTPFMARRSDFIEVERKLIQIPFKHYLKGFCIDGSQFAYPTSLICPLYVGVPLELIPLYNGKRFGPAGGGAIDLSSKNVEVVLFQLMENVLQRLSQVTDLQTFIQYADDRAWVDAGRRSDNWFDYAALGEFDMSLEKMRKILGYDEKATRRGNENDPHPPLALRRAELACQILEAPDTVYDLLHKWEAENVKSMGLEKYWQPTPFPGEDSAN